MVRLGLKDKTLNYAKNKIFEFYLIKLFKKAKFKYFVEQIKSCALSICLFIQMLYIQCY